MSNIIKLKTLLLTPLIKFAVKHPGIMETKIFMKAMIIFPAKLSKSYDAKIVAGINDYEMALDSGLARINSEPEIILDLCTGTGFAAFKIAKLFPVAMIDAVDQSKEMIEIAREKAKVDGIQNIHFKKGNAIILEYTDNEFDFIATSNAPIYLSEAVRVLRPGGLILVAYSFGGDAFGKAKKIISHYLEMNGLKLLEIKSIGSGAYVLGEKK